MFKDTLTLKSTPYALKLNLSVYDLISGYLVADSTILKKGNKAYALALRPTCESFSCKEKGVLKEN